MASGARPERNPPAARARVDSSGYLKTYWEDPIRIGVGSVRDEADRSRDDVDCVQARRGPG
ncbi:hypothetical protein GCM10022205_49070 [Spinactinospora alkalitolerans]